MRCKLGDISEITKLAGYEFTKYIKYIPDGEIIAVRALNLKNGALVLDDIQRISKEVSETLPRSQLHKNDIVLSYTGTLEQKQKSMPSLLMFHLSKLLNQHIQTTFLILGSLWIL